MRVSVVVGLSLALAGCVSSSSPSASGGGAEAPHHADVDRADRDRIEKAYAARDAKALHELLDIISNPDNHALARNHYIKLQLDSLVALDCDAFVAAFQPVRNHPNPRTEFGALTTELDPQQKSYVISTAAGIAARCRSPLLFSAAIHRIAPDADDAAWSAALLGLELKGLPVHEAFVATLRSPKGFDAKLASKWLVASKAASCHELEASSRGAGPEARAFLVYVYAAKACRAEVVHGARELLASRVAAIRARGCRALREVGDTSLMPEMQQLAKSDPARKLEEDRDAIWTYSYTTFPVRETCQQAIDQLATQNP